MAYADSTISRNMDMMKTILSLQGLYFDAFTRVMRASVSALDPTVNPLAAMLPSSSSTGSSRYGEVRPADHRRPAMADDQRAERPTKLHDGAEEQVIDVGEEVLEVEVGRVIGATTRVRRTVNLVPVEHNITLVNETVRIEHIPVGDAAVTEAALHAGEYEMQDVREVPIVNKRVQLRERVVLHRDRTERTETVRDVVRKTEIAVEQPRRMPTVISDRASIDNMMTAPSPAEIVAADAGAEIADTMAMATQVAITPKSPLSDPAPADQDDPALPPVATTVEEQPTQ